MRKLIVFAIVGFAVLGASLNAQTKSPAPESQSSDAATIKQLEAEIKMLRKANEKLTAEVAELKKELAAAKAAPSSQPAVAQGDGNTPAATSQPAKKKDEMIIGVGPKTNAIFVGTVLSVGRIDVYNEVTQENQKSVDAELRILVLIQNTSKDRKFDYRTWRDSATLKDDIGNIYKRINYGLGYMPATGVKSDSIYPDKSLSDILVFEPPVAKAKKLTLTLPGQNGDGDITVEIPVEKIGRH